MNENNRNDRLSVMDTRALARECGNRGVRVSVG